jgi:(1->4)-alpha-D-glucan 1-alpha-D-glucosylmutase
VQRELVATYRVQMRPEFGFDAAAEVVAYLAELGVSHLYCSPYLQAAAGSTHGYDVTDPSRVNEELGGEGGHERLARALSVHGMAQVLDVVPNHMAIIGRANAWWWDVLENGPASRYARYFDVDWDSPQARLRNTVLLPILPDHYGRVLEAGELLLVRRDGGFEIHHHEHQMPVAPRSLDGLLAAAAASCGSPDLAFIADACGSLPEATATDPASTARRHRDKGVLRGQLARLAAERPEVAAAIDAEVAATNADVDRLDALMQRQNYRPAFWRTAGRELDYRRFFDVHTLVGLRVEDERVFADSHARILDWVRRGILDGLRVDHPDGLYDPGQYFERLRRAAPRSWIVAEKILAPGERLPADWPVDGTTGYDFLRRADGLFVDPAGEAPLTALYAELTGAPADWPEVRRAAKLQALRELLAADVNRVAEVFLEVCERHRRHRDYTRHELREAIVEVAASLPVYRTYVRAAGREVSADDRRAISAAIEDARRRRPELDDLLDFFRRLLLRELTGEPEGELAMRFQQLSAPAMAKGVEDTAFYTFNRLVSLNEVGGDPGRFGVSLAAFHRACAEAQARRPHSMLATSTHDTKRGEDARLRLHLLSEVPARWAAVVRGWYERNARHRRPGPLPDANAEYLLYQTLVAAWPIGVERLAAFLEKAAREAKTHTSWTRVDAGYEAALRGFAAALLADAEFRAEVEAFLAPLNAAARVASLSLTLLKLTAPGVPDIYQGSELWHLALVDPDNRRPVDYEQRRRLLAELGELAGEGRAPAETHARRDCAISAGEPAGKGRTPAEAAEAAEVAEAAVVAEAVRVGEPAGAEVDAAGILARMDEGLPKLWVIRQALRLRRRRPAAFGSSGAYRPLAANGSRAAHAVAFERGGEVVTVAPRLTLGLAGDWAETTLPLPAGRWRNELTGEDVAGGERRVGELLARFPVALLARQE